MSDQLKSYKMVDEDYCDNALYVVASDVYLKSEVDKPIAEKDLKINNLEKCKQWMKDHFFCEEIASVEVRHQKYKRCLAISKLCRSEWAAAIFIPEKCMGEKHAERYMRWEKRWLKIAEQFKEAK